MKITRWLVGGYLGLVAVALAWNWWEYLAWVEREATVHGTYPILADGPPLLLSAPTSLVLLTVMPAGWDGHGVFTGYVVAGALVNVAAFLGIRAVVRRRARVVV